MKRLFSLVFVSILTISVLMTACSDDKDDVIVQGVDFPEVKGTLADLKALAVGKDGMGVEIADEIILEGTVVSNPASSNLPKTLFIQVGEAAIKLSVDDSGYFYKSLLVGQRVFLKAQGLYIGVDRDVPLIGDGTDEKYKVGLISNEKLLACLVRDAETIKSVTPAKVTIPELASYLDKVGTVVSIEGVQFAEADRGLTYNTGKDAYTVRTLLDADGNKISVSTYISASFASEIIKGDQSGTVTALLGTYGKKPQLVLRSLDDLDFKTKRFEELGEPEPIIGEKVFFSEYGEGSGQNKYLEIYNGTGNEIDLANYAIRLGIDDKDWKDAQVLSGKLAAGDVFLICHAEADDKIKAASKLENSNAVTFNGNDAVGLFKKVNNRWSLCDVIGVVGLGEESTINDISGATKDHTLLRKEGVTTGNTDWASAINEWDVKDKDYWYSLGIIGVGDHVDYNFVNKTVDALSDAFASATNNERLDAEGWFTEAVKGAVFWKTVEDKSGKYIKATGFSTGQDAVESWVVTPALDLDAAARKNLTFHTRRGHSKEDKFTVWVSSDFDYKKGVEAANWTELKPSLPEAVDKDFSKWKSVGNIDLSVFTGKVHVAFKYVGNDTDASGTWNICNVKFNYDPADQSGNPKEIVEKIEFCNWGVELWEDDNKPEGFFKSENVNKETTIKHGGKYSIKQTSSRSAKDISFKAPVEAGATYEVSYWYLDNDPKAQTRLWARFLADSKPIKDKKSEDILHPKKCSTDNVEWQQVKFEVVTPADASIFEFEVRTYKESEEGGVIYFDDFNLVKK